MSEPEPQSEPEPEVVGTQVRNPRAGGRAYTEEDRRRYEEYIARGGNNPRREDIPPEMPMNTMRERLQAFGRLERFEVEGARRRRQRALNPQIMTDDVYRARQRLALQQVLDQYTGGINIPKLTGEGHTNPTVEAMGGKVGGAVTRRDLGGVDTEQEVQASFEREQRAGKKGGAKPKQGLKK